MFIGAWRWRENGRMGDQSPIICFIAYRFTLAIRLATLRRGEILLRVALRKETPK